MWPRRRRSRQLQLAREPGLATSDPPLPAVRAERALVALAVHAQQLDERLARIEARLDADEAAAAAVEAEAMEAATHDELLEVRLHSARVAAEVSRLAINLQARIDDLAVKIPDAAARADQDRARVFAETILDLSDGLDTTMIDLRDEPDDWAATA